MGTAVVAVEKKVVGCASAPLGNCSVKLPSADVQVPPPMPISVPDATVISAVAFAAPLAAVIVVVPFPIARTAPLADTVATVGSEDDQVTG